MSVTAVGPAYPLVGPPPHRREHALLSIPGVLVDDPSDPPRWLTQVNVIGYPDGVPQLWEACSSGTDRVKGSASPRPQGTFNPFAAVFPLECWTASIGPFTEFYGQADAALDATLSHSIEEALAQGIDTNPFFGDTGFISLGLNVSPIIGLAMLENAIGFDTGREGMIHASPAIVAQWTYGNNLYIDDEGVLRTYNDTPVAAGSGYIGRHPTGGGGLPAATATSDWAYATGPVEVRVEAEPRHRIEETLDRNDNTVIVYSERYVLAEWDTALQVGVLIDWTL